MTMLDIDPLIVLDVLDVSLLPEDHYQYFERRLQVRRVRGGYEVTHGDRGKVLSRAGEWHIKPETYHSTRNDDYRAWLRDHRFDGLYDALNAASLAVGHISGPGGMTTHELMAFDSITPYRDRGRDTSRALTGVRAVLSRAETERDGMRIYEQYASEPETSPMRDALALTVFLLGRWRRTGRPAKTETAR